MGPSISKETSYLPSPSASQALGIIFFVLQIGKELLGCPVGRR